MIITQTNQAIILADEYNDIVDFANYLITSAGTRFRESNLIIDVLKYKDATLAQIEAFTPLFEAHKECGKSIVIISDTIDFNEVSEQLIVVPTLQEAQDIIEMEEIERDLGF